MRALTQDPSRTTLANRRICVQVRPVSDCRRAIEKCGFLMGALDQRFGVRFDAGGDRFQEFRFFGAGQSPEFRAGFGGES